MARQLDIFGHETEEDDAPAPAASRQLTLAIGRALAPLDDVTTVTLFGDQAAEAGDATWQRDTAAFARKPRQSLAQFKAAWRARLLGATARSRPPRPRSEAEKNRALTAAIRATTTMRVTRPTAFAPRHTRGDAGCQCARCQRKRWDRAGR